MGDPGGLRMGICQSATSKRQKKNQKIAQKTEISVPMQGGVVGENKNRKKVGKNESRTLPC